MMNIETITVSEAARLLNKDPQTIRKWATKLPDDHPNKLIGKKFGHAYLLTKESVYRKLDAINQGLTEMVSTVNKAQEYSHPHILPDTIPVQPPQQVKPIQAVVKHDWSKPEDLLSKDITECIGHIPNKMFKGSKLIDQLRGMELQRSYTVLDEMLFPLKEDMDVINKNIKEGMPKYYGITIDGDNEYLTDN